ncbi:hypothetical protein N7478_007051 [Penicillium angulare]|uniref:uncharacterized protein n=1 Tax=Penicillium angulare TaxID=116970 RepID=UPI0025407268|nr:uncharacterized protein N7478_007051 [Penicillium angulare]KAJ5281679.1 hypothetical protein N7478_007051 [Penicillium angulare]
MSGETKRNPSTSVRIADAYGSTAEFGVNTRNMDPMELLYVSRKVDHAWVLAPVNNKAVAHEQDQAKY